MVFRSTYSSELARKTPVSTFITPTVTKSTYSTNAAVYRGPAKSSGSLTATQSTPPVTAASKENIAPGTESKYILVNLNARSRLLGSGMSTIAGTIPCKNKIVNIYIVMPRKTKHQTSERSDAKIAKSIFLSSRKNRRTRINLTARTALRIRNSRIKLKLMPPIKTSVTTEVATKTRSKKFQPHSPGATQNQVRNAIIRKSSSTTKIKVKAVFTVCSQSGGPALSPNALLILRSASMPMKPVLDKMSMFWKMENAGCSVILAKALSGICLCKIQPLNPTSSSKSCQILVVSAVWERSAWAYALVATSVSATASAISAHKASHFLSAAFSSASFAVPCTPFEIPWLPIATLDAGMPSMSPHCSLPSMSPHCSSDEDVSCLWTLFPDVCLLMLAAASSCLRLCKSSSFDV
mmetsp:Transcript_40867/g.72498  ORF Transcript_40867/g.72498 Transcript_40867/m.72498 type:complete len:408 (-) Transcript_40867:247-1470(-)